MAWQICPPPATVTPNGHEDVLSLTQEVNRNSLVSYAHDISDLLHELSKNVIEDDLQRG
jgi:hypothetical protein